MTYIVYGEYYIQLVYESTLAALPLNLAKNYQYCELLHYYLLRPLYVLLHYVLNMHLLFGWVQ